MHGRRSLFQMRLSQNNRQLCSVRENGVKQFGIVALHVVVIQKVTVQDKIAIFVAEPSGAGEILLIDVRFIENLAATADFHIAAEPANQIHINAAWNVRVVAEVAVGCEHFGKNVTVPLREDPVKRIFKILDSFGEESNQYPWPLEGAVNLNIGSWFTVQYQKIFHLKEDSFRIVPLKYGEKKILRHTMTSLQTFVNSTVTENKKKRVWEFLKALISKKIQKKNHSHDGRPVVPP